MKASKVLFLVFLSILSLCVVNTQPARAAKNPWTTKVPMPTAGAGFKAAVVNDKVYVVKLNITYEYNLYSWSTKKPMSTPRDDFGIAIYKNKIYCIGGRTNSSSTGINEVYDPATDTWKTKTSIPTPRHGLDANVVNGKIYLIGGLVTLLLNPNIPSSLYYNLTNLNEVYDPETDTWETKAPIPNAAIYYASAVVNNKIYVISETLTQIYNPETDTWSFGASIPYPVDMAGGAATTGAMAPQRIYVIGGRESGLEVPYNQVYNPEKDFWSLGTPMPTPRYMLAAAVVNDRIYAIGGLSGAFAVTALTDRNEQYNPLEDTTIPIEQSEPFPITWIVAAIAITAVVGAALLVYFRKIKKTTGKAE